MSKALSQLTWHSFDDTCPEHGDQETWIVLYTLSVGCFEACALEPNNWPTKAELSMGGVTHWAYLDPPVVSNAELHNAFE